MKLQDKFGKDVWDFHPRTFLIPEDLERLHSICTKSPKDKWIVKPSLGGQGEGIKLLNSSEVLKRGSFPVDGTYIVQK